MWLWQTQVLRRERNISWNGKENDQHIIHYYPTIWFIDKYCSMHLCVCPPAMILVRWGILGEQAVLSQCDSSQRAIFMNHITEHIHHCFCTNTHIEMKTILVNLNWTSQVTWGHFNAHITQGHPITQVDMMGYTLQDNWVDLHPDLPDLSKPAKAWLSDVCKRHRVWSASAYIRYITAQQLTHADWEMP